MRDSRNHLSRALAALCAFAWILASPPTPVPCARAEPNPLSDASPGRIASDLRALCSVKTGRVPGTPGYGEALGHAERELRALGFAPRRQEITVHRFFPDTLLVRVRTGDSSPSPLTLHSLARSGGTISGEFPLLDLEEGTLGELRTVAPLLPGKILLVTAGDFDQGGAIHRLELVDRAAAAGAAAVLFCSPLRCELQGVVAWTGRSAIPAYSGADLDGLKRLQAEGAPLLLRAQDRKEGAWREVDSANLVAELKGGSPASGQILVSAHLDAWNLGQGALDNAAGVCVLLETARLLSDRMARTPAPRLERTIRFVLFTGEELGLEGSRAYLERVSAGNEPAPSVICNLEMCESPAGFVIHAGEDLTPFLQRVVLERRDLGLDQGVVRRLDLYSDHMPFLLAGYPSFTLAYHREEDSILRAHTQYDRAEAIDPLGLARSAELLAATLLELAQSAVPIPPRLDEAELGHLFARNGRELSRVRSLGY